LNDQIPAGTKGIVVGRDPDGVWVRMYFAQENDTGGENLTHVVLTNDIHVVYDDPTAEEVADACLSYNHNYGLMNPADRGLLEHSAREWLWAWRKTGVA